MNGCIFLCIGAVTMMTTTTNEAEPTRYDVIIDPTCEAQMVVLAPETSEDKAAQPSVSSSELQTQDGTDLILACTAVQVVPQEETQCLEDAPIPECEPLLKELVLDEALFIGDTLARE